jgi:hypothetical protein
LLSIARLYRSKGDPSGSTGQCFALECGIVAHPSLKRHSPLQADMAGAGMFGQEASSFAQKLALLFDS